MQIGYAQNDQGPHDFSGGLGTVDQFEVRMLKSRVVWAFTVNDLDFDWKSPTIKP